MFSNHRNFLDSIDVDDLPADYPTAVSPGSRPRSYSRPTSLMSTSTSASIPSLSSLGSVSSSSQLVASPQTNMANTSAPLHCTLFLFDDKLMIVKRQSSSISGQKVTGLDDVQRLVKTGGGVAVMDKNSAKKDKLSFRGVVDVLDVIASDVGNGGELLCLPSAYTNAEHIKISTFSSNGPPQANPTGGHLVPSDHFPPSILRLRYPWIPSPTERRSCDSSIIFGRPKLTHELNVLQTG